MKCNHLLNSINKKSISNHKRWCEGKMKSDCMKGINVNNKNGMWKDMPGKIALHEWIRNRKTKPNFCEICKTKPPRDLANISQRYKRDIADFEWLCRRCHMTKDGRLKNLHPNYEYALPNL